MRVAPLLPVLALLGVLVTGTIATAEVYRWTDASGRLHFTQRLDQVPAEYRDAALRAALRGPKRRVQTFGESTPAAAQAPRRRAARHGGEVRVPFVRESSLMRVEVRLNDIVTAPFLIDTGASGVSLPSWVADRLGVRVRPDTPHVNVMTANGVVSRALIRLDAVELGGARVENLEATVNPSMDIGLLGGAFFNNFVYRVDAAASVITLTPNDNIRGGLGEGEWRKRFRNIVDPLERLDAYLAADELRRRGETARLEQRRTELRAELERLESQANRLDVPQSWRQ